MCSVNAERILDEQKKYKSLRNSLSQIVSYIQLIEHLKKVKQMIDLTKFA